MTAHQKRGTWRHDAELELSALLRLMPTDELREARRLIAHELASREQTAGEKVTESARAMFKA